MVTSEQTEIVLRASAPCSEGRRLRRGYCLCWIGLLFSTGCLPWPPVPAPTFDPGGGEFAEPFYVSISCGVPGTLIVYTMDGLSPSKTRGTIYSGPILLTDSATIRAVAYKEWLPESEEAVATFTMRERVGTPTFTPPGGVFTESVEVAVSSATPDATILYTTDGSEPSCSSGITYQGPIQLTSTTTLKAAACKDGMLGSLVAMATFTRPNPVATPTFSPSPGTFIASTDITLSCATPGATICYTTDGSVPSMSHGTVYSGPIRLTDTAIVMAIAWKAGMTISPVGSAIYTKLGQVSAPVFNPSGGYFVDSRDVTLSCSTPGATIIYTTDGSTPSGSNGTVYTSPIHLTATTTVRAIARVTGRTDSEVVSATFTQQGQVTTPEFTPPAGTFSGSTDVTISCTTIGATIIYTTDGSTPSSSHGTFYSSPIHVTSTTTIKAIAVLDGMTDSVVASAAYTQEGQVATPDFSPPAGAFGGSTDVTISCTTPGATIIYTTDGSTPSSSHGTFYSSAIHLTSTTTIKAIALVDGMIDSVVASGTFTQQTQVSTPVHNPLTSSYDYSLDVTLSCATPGAIIVYTTDGSTPTATHGAFYSAPIHLTETTTIKAFAYKPDLIDSTVSSETYTRREEVASPTFSPDGGVYIESVNVTMSCTTSGAEIRYTTNGSDPTPTTGTVYTVPLALTATTTVKAMAWKPGAIDSSIRSATFTRLPPGWYPMTSGVTSRLWAVWGTSATNIFAVGVGGTVLHYDGTSWSPMVSNTPLTLRGVWGSAASDVFAVGNSGAVTHYNGSTWSTMVSGVSDTIYAVHGIDAGNVFGAIGGGYVATYNGSTWSSVNTGTANNLFGIWAAAADDIFAVGSNGAIRRYSGGSWEGMTSGTTMDLYSVWGTANNNVYAVGMSGRVQRYDGSNWSGTAYGSKNLYCVHGNSASDIYAVGDTGTILHYDGSNWLMMPSGTTEHLYGVWSNGPTRVFAVGDNGTILFYHP